MTVRNLEFLFRPKSIAVVSESEAGGRYADVILRNLSTGGFTGPIISISAKNRSLFGITGRISIEKPDLVPDLAIICAAVNDVPEIISQLGELGTRAVIVALALQNDMNGPEAMAARKAILNAARPHLVRVLGPGSRGILVPANALNASFSTVSALPGKIALITQSTAIASAILESATSSEIGFSTVVHLGASIDVDLADVLDWLATDPATESILVQFDSVSVGRKFMSAARATARNKRVFAIRGGRVAPSNPEQRLLPVNEVYEAALRRAGWVSINTLDDMFETIEAIARVRPMRGARLSIIANGQGLGSFAADTLIRSGGRLATLSTETLHQLEKLLPTAWPIGIPLALQADVSPQGWASALSAVLADDGVDAVLTVCSPSSFADPADVATAICAIAQHVAQPSQRNVFTSWMGGTSMLVAQRIAAAHGVYSHDSPEKAVSMFLGVANYERNRQLLLQMPTSIAEDFTPNQAIAQKAVAEAMAAGEDTLTSRQTIALLHAYGIDMVKSLQAKSIPAAIHAAEEIGYPVDLALVLSTATEFDWTERGLRSPADIHLAVRGLRGQLSSMQPTLSISGYRITPSAARGCVEALRIGVVDDPVFGPMIFLAPSAVNGKIRKEAWAAALPPLNRLLAHELISRGHFTDTVSAERREGIESVLSTTLVRLSQLLTDIDEVVGVELDPLFVDNLTAVVQDARIQVRTRSQKKGFRSFAICPYPKELEREVDWNGHKLLIRPVRPDDETTLANFISSLDPVDSRMRFFMTMKRLPRSQLARFTQIDYDREMALMAIERDAKGVERSFGEVRVVADPDNKVAEFAIVISSSIKGKGLGRLLMTSMIDYSRQRGIEQLRGETLLENVSMQGLAKSLGFTLAAGSGDVIELSLKLRESGRE